MSEPIIVRVNGQQVGAVTQLSVDYNASSSAPLSRSETWQGWRLESKETCDFASRSAAECWVIQLKPVQDKV